MKQIYGDEEYNDPNNFFPLTETELRQQVEALNNDRMNAASSIIRGIATTLYFKYRKDLKEIKKDMLELNALYPPLEEQNHESKLE